jgi:hypothetical protein
MVVFDLPFISLKEKKLLPVFPTFDFSDIIFS